MAEWQERVQSMILGFVFAFMVMKLISVISSFRNANLRVTREVDEEGVGAGLSSVDEQSVPLTGTDEEVEADGGDEKEDRVDDSSSSSSQPESEDDAAPTSRSREVHTTDAAGVSEAESKDEEVKPKDDEEVEEIITPGAASLKALSEQVSDDVEAESEGNETDDWEGVESTELEKLFGAASTYADKMVDLFSEKPSPDAMLQLQALYKIATEGPCSTSQPSPFQPAARAKWNAWQQLGNMSQEKAMEKYISILTEINPAWYESYQKSREKVNGSNELVTNSKGHTDKAEPSHASD